MSWAARRRFIILLIIGAVITAFLTVIGIATFYKEPSCSDGVRNQDETGIDCGGSCNYLCIEQQNPPTVLFTKVIQNVNERVDVIAEVENKNAVAAAKNVPYKITLYGSDQFLIQEITGTVDLPPRTIVPIFFPGISSGKQIATRAFLEIDYSSIKWFSMQSDLRILPNVSNLSQTGTTSSPRIEAVLTNSSVNILTNVKAIVLVHNEKGDVIAASSTIVPYIPAQGKATAVFTWNYEFPSTPASIEIIPIVSLP
ncbi:MAG: hypothetical protein Q8L30_00065 [bacterium]|nr:hypothetical protein [bacterium]